MKTIPIDEHVPSLSVDEVAAHVTCERKNFTEIQEQSADAIEAVSSEIEKFPGLEIDKNNLDQELCQQPDVMGRACQLASVALAWDGYLSALLKAAQADLASGMREELEANQTKYSEATINNKVGEFKVHQKIKDMQVQWAYWASRTAGLKDTLFQRSTALSRLTELWSQEYFIVDSK